MAAVLVLSACVDPPPPPPRSTLAEACFELSDAWRSDPAPGVPASASVRDRFEALQRRAVAVTRGKAPQAAARALAGLLFDEQGFRREVDDPSPGRMLLPGVIAGRCGSCVGLSMLYLALAQSAGLPAHAVLAPGHLFVRVDDGATHHNVELLRMGELMPDAWYPERFHAPRGVAAYLRPLSEEQAVAVLVFNLGNAERARGRNERARTRYRVALQTFADFPEAWASLGLVSQQLGDRDAAEAAYREAAALYPALPGLQRNRAALAE